MIKPSNSIRIAIALEIYSNNVEVFWESLVYYCIKVVQTSECSTNLISFSHGFLQCR